ncbi:MAG TPA: RNA polymerase sigma factor [Chitinophagaceae bacterium]|nr:RNA polymerase sigma factor [Chitinophagaceae bacterium]
MNERELIQSAIKGNKASLQKLIVSAQDQVYNLALRFLWNKMDAEDATQEILIKLITNLSKFDGRSKFSTWSYRVAVNYLINYKKTALENRLSSFDVFSQDLASATELRDYNEPGKQLLEKEMKTGCTLAMLQCLNRDQRMAYILGGILGINSILGAKLTNTTSQNFRKRLEQARKSLVNFLNKNCGVFNPANTCRCNKRIHYALAAGRIQTDNLNFRAKLESLNEEMEELNSLAGIYKNHGTFESSTDLISQINHLIATKQIMRLN